MKVYIADNDYSLNQLIFDCLQIECKRKSNNSLHVYNKNLKNNNKTICDGKEIIFLDNFSACSQTVNHVIFNPLSEQKESCSYLLMNDSMHLALQNKIYSLFEKIITAKDGSSEINKVRLNQLNQIKLDELPNPTKHTIHKFYHLYNLLTATSYSQNIIRFSFEINDSLENIKVDFQYPLYDALKTSQNNTIFGIYLDDTEMQFFKLIFEEFIIKIVNNLFSNGIEIPKDSNRYPLFYALIITSLKIEEVFWQKYHIAPMDYFKRNLPKYYKRLNNLNQEVSFPWYDEKQKEIDKQSYKNELEIRKASEPDWNLLKDSKMKKTLNNKQLPATTNTNIETLIFESLEKNRTDSYEKMINRFLQEKQIDNFKNDYTIIENNKAYSEIFYWQNLVLRILNENGTNLWFDTRTDKYYFRSKIGGDIVEENKEGISDLLTRALQEKITSHINAFNRTLLSSYAIQIVLVNNFSSISKQILQPKDKASYTIKILLFENAIYSIDDDRFETQSSFEFFQEYNGLFYTRNRFIPTKHLIKRFNNSSLPNLNVINYRKFNHLFKISENGYLLEKVPLQIEDKLDFQSLSFIEQFIFFLVKEDIHLYYYTMNWLACFFNNLQKSGTALVLVGEKELTEGIIWDKIIKEIFGLQYCVTINDNECKSPSFFDIAKDKLFFHIGDITNPVTKFDDTTLYKLVKDFLVKPSIAKINENNKQEEVSIHGQIIVTAKNPAPYIKKAISKCTVIAVNDIDTIVEKLGVPDELILEDKIEKDLDNFTNILNSFAINDTYAKYAIDTEDKQQVTDNKSSNIDKEDIEKQIDDFIAAIKGKDIDYFEKLKDTENGQIIYEHLQNAFNQDDGYFIGQDLLHYYNATHEVKFENKDQLMTKLKQKDEMFAQEVKTLKILNKNGEEETLFKGYQTNKATNYKELYKIDGYIMAKNITIPYGAVIITTQKNIQRFNHPDLENALKINADYKAEKEKNSQN